MQNKSKIIIYCPSKLSHGGIVLLDDLLMKLKDFNYELFVHPQAAKLIKIKKKTLKFYGVVLLEGCSQKFHFPLRRHKKIKYFVIRIYLPSF